MKGLQSSTVLYKKHLYHACSRHAGLLSSTSDPGIICVAGELLSKLQDRSVTVVISLSRQSLASLATLYKLTPQETAARLVYSLKVLGAAAVLDAGTGRELALLEAATEFLRRYREKHAVQIHGMLTTPCI